MGYTPTNDMPIGDYLGSIAQMPGGKVNPDVKFGLQGLGLQVKTTPVGMSARFNNESGNAVVPSKISAQEMRPQPTMQPAVSQPT
jgi:hypothetical protein